METTTLKPTEPPTVNPTPQTGEDPQSIGASVAKLPAKRWERTRKRKPQNERLQAVITMIDEVPGGTPQEKEDLRQLLQAELANEPNKKRLKIIYRAESKLKAWGGKFDENIPTASPAGPKAPKSTKPPKANLEVTKTNLIETAKRIEEKLRFCEAHHIEIHATGRYNDLRKKTAEALKLPASSQAKALQKLLAEAQEVETAIVAEREEQLLHQPKGYYNRFTEWWFLFRLKMFILMLLPEKEWPRASREIRTAAELGNYGDIGKAMLHETANNLDEMVKNRQRKRKKKEKKTPTEPVDA